MTANAPDRGNYLCVHWGSPPKWVQVVISPKAINKRSLPLALWLSGLLSVCLCVSCSISLSLFSLSLLLPPPYAPLTLSITHTPSLTPSATFSRSPLSKLLSFPIYDSLFISSLPLAILFLTQSHQGSVQCISFFSILAFERIMFNRLS